jgi:hypothetical protein
MIVVLIKLRIPIRHPAWRYVSLKPYDWLYSLAFTLTVEVHYTVHSAMIGDGKGIHSQALYMGYQIRQLTHPNEK